MFLIKRAALVNLKFCYTGLGPGYDGNLRYLEKSGHLGSGINRFYGSSDIRVKPSDDNGEGGDLKNNET